MMVKYVMAMDTWNRPLTNCDEDETLAGEREARLRETIKVREAEEKEESRRKARNRRTLCSC